MGKAGCGQQSRAGPVFPRSCGLPGGTPPERYSSMGGMSRYGYVHGAVEGSVTTLVICMAQHQALHGHDHMRPLSLAP